MKKGIIITVATLVVVVLAGSGYAILHAANKPATTSATSSAPAVSNAVLVTKTSSSLGQYLAEPNGKPLYTYGGDSKSVSTCTGTCLALWPAYQDQTGNTHLPAGVSTIKRSDNGELQFTYNGMPLYTFVSDIGGHVTGNGVQNFTVAKPASATSSSASNQSGTSSSTSTSSSSSNDSSW